ncbi:MAG: DUF4058 family protein [Oscillatoriaceae cyanobacterium Prado104]|jgi:hypothetical protein|nr:DUF4058 family protein [Oscillatoriaceae cyanobacterium Prado104]
MPSPFPGVDPYLEHPDFWPGIHNLLIAEIARFLSPQLRPKYRVAVEVRMYETSGENSLAVGIPDITIQRRSTASNPSMPNVAVLSPAVQPVKVTLPIPEIVREAYLAIKQVEKKEVVTTIEILSPTNKRSGKGREMYEKKREQILGSRTHLIEIDLLRRGEPMPVFGNNINSLYRILVCRGNRLPSGDMYAFNLQNSIPAFPVPLRPEDVEPIVDLQQLFNQVYDIAGYDMEIDYSREPIPPLSETDTVWADVWLRDRGLRS